MELKDRLRIVLDEQNIKQKDLAETIKVTESYVSNMLKGKRNNISESLALLLEQKYGYSANWILNGIEPKMSKRSKIKDLSPIQRKVISDIEQMDETDLAAVKAFISSLSEYKKSFGITDES